MSNSTVWLCNYGNTEFVNIYGIQAVFPNIYDAVTRFKMKQRKEKLTLNERESYDEMLATSGKVIDRWFASQYFAPEHMPEKIYREPNEELPNESDVIFKIVNGYLVVNQTCYDIISKHNLGKTHFSQVHIYDIETQEQLSDKPYYFINIAETREFLDVENTHSGISENEYNPDSGVYFLSSVKDNDINLTSQANAVDVDLWHDPKLFKSLFLSNKLVVAMLDAGISKESLSLISCNA